AYELSRALKRPMRLMTRGEIDVDLDDRSTVHEIGDGRHGMNGQRSQELRNPCEAIVTLFRHDCCTTTTRRALNGRSYLRVGPLSQRGKDRPIVSPKSGRVRGPSPTGLSRRHRTTSR